MMTEHTGSSQRKEGISIKMDKLCIFVLVTLSTSSFWVQSVDSFRNDLVMQAQSSRQGCIWSTTTATNSVTNGNATQIPVTLKSGVQPSFSLDCNLRTLNADFWNYTFNKDQIEHTNHVGIKCSDKLYFESFLTSNQSLFQLYNLKHITINGCKTRKMPSRIWSSLGYLKSLRLSSQNGDWSSSVGLEIEAGAFEGLGQLESLDLTENNIWNLPHKNIFCPLKSLSRMNLSRNRLSDIEELSGSEDAGNAYCALTVQNLDLSHNTLRRLGNNAFSRMKKLSELRLQNNLIEEIEDNGFGSLGQLRLLNLSSNRLVALPPSIFKLSPSLREINLSNNTISAISPQVFSQLNSLLSLDLSQNTLTSQWIKDTVFSGLVRLVILRLSLNQLSYIDGAIFQNLGNLQALHLDGNRIENIHPEAFKALRNLHVLSLQNNRLSQIDSQVFGQLFVIQQLYLDHNKIRSMDDNSLRNCTNLKDLGLADNLLQEVPVALRVGLIHLVTLDIGENQIAHVTNTSYAGMSQLYGLRMVDNRVRELPAGFCDPLRSLRVLNSAQNRISKISPSAFTACPELRALRLDANDLDELPTTLSPQLPNLLWLNVSENRIRWADYHYLPRTIEWLDLSYNLIETLGGPSSERMSESYSLRVLDASHNLITSLDYTTIPPTLETLRVNHNRLKNIAADTFIRSNLRRLELKMNQIETLPLASIRFPQVPVGKPLAEIFLGGNLFWCNNEMEWLTRVNQLTALRTYPRIVDLDTVVCRPTFSRTGSSVVPLSETRPNDFLSPYQSHCFSLCVCCDFSACDCRMECPTNCSCYHDSAWSSNIIECSNVQYENIPLGIPMDATELYLDGNNLTQLGSHVFIGKKNLRVLYLNDSNIELIRNKTFNGLRSLEVLRLEDNFLRVLSGFEFSDLENIRELYLQNNLLSMIARETFAHLKFLQVLRLDMNLLINFNVWELSGNGYLNSVMLASNPWDCSCEFLIPFRTWVASKAAVVADFTLAKCQEVNDTHVLTGSSSGGSQEIDHYATTNTAVIPATTSHSKKVKTFPIQMQHPIIAMCNHNSEINFNFNPIRAIESEILSNHISAMAGGAEKVTIPHPSEREIQFSPVDSSSTFWSLVLSLTALIVLVVVIAAIFRKEIYYWIYTRVCSSNNSTSAQELRGSDGGAGRGRFLSSSLLPSLLCCGEKAGKKSRSADGDDSDKLFDAYFIYSKKDEDILGQKIAPELESQGPPHYRLCLHYRDLCINPDNPWNTDMIMGASDASKRVVLVLSRTFLQFELTHSHFRQAIQSAINRHQKKLILILLPDLPPFTEQNLATIYPELKNTCQVKSSTLEWTDKNFWSKFKLILPTPSHINIFSTIARNRRAASLLMSGTLPSMPAPLIDLHSGGGGSSNNSNASGTMSSYTINRLDFPYSSGHQYHRNILPYQIPMSNNCNTLNPPVPKHHIALTTTTPFYPHQQNNHQPQSHYHQSQQNFSLYNASQHSGSQSQHYFQGNNNVQNFLPIHPGIGGGVVHPMSTLPNHFSFNESFRRHLQQNQSQQNQHQNSYQGGPAPVLQFAKQQSSSGGNSSNAVSSGQGTKYQPLEPNYSSSAISSSAEEHLYSTLEDSPLQSPNTTNSTIVMNTSGGGGGESQGKNISESANKLTFSNKRSSNGNGGQCSQNERQQPGNNNNGQMYFV